MALLIKFCSGALLLLGSCCKPQPWNFRTVVSGCPWSNSAQLSYRPDNAFNGIGVEFLRTSCGVACFLNIYARELSPNTQIYFHVEGCLSSWEGILMEGGQRLQLSAEGTAFLIEALLAHPFVIVEVEGYRQQLEGGLFTKYYQKFLCN